MGKRNLSCQRHFQVPNSAALTQLERYLATKNINNGISQNRFPLLNSQVPSQLYLDFHLANFLLLYKLNHQTGKQICLQTDRYPTSIHRVLQFSHKFQTLLFIACLHHLCCLRALRKSWRESIRSLDLERKQGAKIKDTLISLPELIDSH